MKSVYVLIDWDDCRSAHVFAQRRNAIQYAYEHCEAFGAFLCVNEWDPLRKWRRLSLSDAARGTNPIDYLNTLNDKDINDVFYDYYFLTEVEIEDIENNERD